MGRDDDDIVADALKRIDRERSVTRRLEDIELKVDVVGDLVSLLLGITLAGLAYQLLVDHFGWIVAALAAAVVFVVLRFLTRAIFRR